jgi:acetylornithine deacetylase
MSFDPIDFLERAVQTPSHEDVTEMRDLLVETLETEGVPAEVDDAGNALAVRDSGREGPHVVLNTHIDTVPPHVPFSRNREGENTVESYGNIPQKSINTPERGENTPQKSSDMAEKDENGGESIIRGRGSCDAKGPLSAMLAAFLDADLERGRVTLAITPDEETNSTGAAALAFGSGPDVSPSFDPEPDAVIVGEPTELDVCNAAKGRFQATVTVRGANAHAAEPHEGVNAVRAAGDLLSALDSFDEREESPDPSDTLGAPTLAPTTIEGGTATNQVPAECSFVVDRRSVPPENAEGFRSALESHLRERAPPEVDVEVSLAERDTPFLAAFETPADSELATTLRDASGGRVRPFGAATEASYFAQVAPTVVFGPGALADDEGAVAHAPREYVRVAEVERAATAIRKTLADLCS